LAVSPVALGVLLPIGVLAALAGGEMVVALGVVANPGIAGVLAGMALARLPGALFRPVAGMQGQAMVHAVAAAASIGAGQALLLPIGIPFVLGRMDLVGPVFLGAFLALLVDGWLMWRLFGGAAYPAEAAWPAGAGAAAVIRAGAEGDRPGALVLAGMAVGLCGAIYRAPMAAFGVALLGHPWPVGMFAAGVLLRAHGAPALGWLGPGGDLMLAQVPQGMLAGAALVAVGQMLWPAVRGGVGRGGASHGGPLGVAAAAHLGIALLLALAGGLHAAMTPGMLALFVAFAGGAALLHALVVGVAAMHAGWLPSLAAASVVLALGMLIGFPTGALCLLVGFSAATGPGFAAMGQALKAAHALDGDAAALRMQGQAVMLGFVVAGAVVWLMHGGYFAEGRVAPGGRVFAIAMRAGIGPEVAAKLAVWAVVGAGLQLWGGVRRQLGVMLAVGMLLMAPAVGWAVATGLAVRWWMGERHRAGLELFGAGAIAGDALFGLYDAAGRVSVRK
jgi:hypothetical protein